MRTPKQASSSPTRSYVRDRRTHSLHASMTYRSSSVRARLFDDALREAMQTPVPEGCAVEVPPAADPAAGTVSPEPDPAKVKINGRVIDTDSDRSYGDRVQDADTLDGLSEGHKSRLHSSTPLAESVPSQAAWDDALSVFDPGAREAQRQSRLRLWQVVR